MLKLEERLSHGRGERPTQHITKRKSWHPKALNQRANLHSPFSWSPSCIFSYFFYFFWLCYMACRILVPWSRIELVPLQYGLRVLTTGLPGKSPIRYILMPSRVVSLVAQSVKSLPATPETWVWSLGREVPLEKEMATQSSILAWRIHAQRSLGGYSP